MTTHTRLVLRVLLAALAVTCGGGRPQPIVVAPHAAAPYVPPSTDWCRRIHGGPRGAGDPVLALSAANAGIRFFGVEATLATVDQALAHALAGDGPLDISAALPVYARALRGVCVVPADDRPLSAVQIERVGAWAVIHPGTGPVTLPAGTTAVAIDLRDLPAGDLGAILDAAVAPALATPVPRAARVVRQRYGMDDEVYAPGKNVYHNYAATVDGPPIPATGTRDLPLVLLSGPTLAPAAAELAGTLRLAHRAWLFGEDVLASVAESEWTAVGAQGLVWRAADLQVVAGTRWPDVIPADRYLAAGATVEALATLDPAALGTPSGVAGTTGTRPAIAAVPGTLAIEEGEVDRGALRAGLLLAHGALRLWFPYFAVVGDTIDARLLETLASAAALPNGFARTAAVHVLGRLGEAIHDGHHFIGDPRARDATRGQPTRLALALDVIDDEVVVMRSGVPGIAPGDTLLAIGAETVVQRFQDRLPRTSGATRWHRTHAVSRSLLRVDGPTVVTVRDVKGTTRQVTVDPVTPEAAQSLGFSQSLRAAGFLSTQGAKQLYYLNLSQEVLTDLPTFRQQLTAAEKAKGLILDMRGYPGVSHFEVAQRIIPQDFATPHWIVAIRTGPHAIRIDDQHKTFSPLSAPAYAGPVVLLVGPETMSAAEDFGIYLVGAKRVTVVGRTSAGTDGNITGVQLPGGLSFSFTGMDLRFTDGATFHGVGLVPDVVVHPTAADYAAGRDAELLQAIQVLQGKPGKTGKAGKTGKTGKKKKKKIEG